MDFDPINDDHAIQGVAFSVNFQEPFSAAAIAAAHDLHRSLHAELPAQRTPQHVEITVEASGPRAISGGVGIEFAHLRPDGTPAWALRLVGNSVVVECSRYTRWERVWGQAARYIDLALDAIQRSEPSKRIQVVGLLVSDVFLSREESYDLSTLFGMSEFLPRRAFAMGPMWHCHLGWFDPWGERSILNNLNIDARRRERLASGARRPIEIAIGHVQEARFPEPTNIDRFVIEESMNRLHGCNKSVISSLLSQEMRVRIGLGDQS